MKILHLVGTLNNGGIERIVSQLALTQKREYGHQPLIGCVLRKEGVYLKALLNENIPVYDLSYTSKNPLVLTRKLISLLETENPDLIHSHVNFSLLFQAIPRYFHPIPFVLTQHSFSAQSKTLPFKTRAYISYKILQRKPFQHTTVSQLAAEYVTSVYPTSINQIVVIHNGINADDFRFNAEHRRRIREQWNVSNDEIVIGCVGRLDYVKGYDILLEAFDHVSQMLPSTPLRLVIAGKGEQMEALVNQNKQYQNAHRVQWLGRIDNVPEALSAFDLYAQASRWETMSVAIAEALANGLNVVTTKKTGIAEFNSFSDRLFISPNLDPLVFAQTLENAVIKNGKNENRITSFPQELLILNMVKKYDDIYRQFQTQ